MRELQEHVKRETAPYKYPRIIDFAAELPKTASGKVKRAAAAGRLGALTLSQRGARDRRSSGDADLPSGRRRAASA